MSTPTFAETHNLVAFLEKPSESAGFEQIIDFLKSKPINYALTVNPTIYVSCVKQFFKSEKEGTVCLLNEAIFEGMTRMSVKTTAWNEFSSTMASAIICLADNQKFNFSNDPLPSGEDSSILNEMMVFCTSLQEQSRPEGLRRLKKFGSGRRVKSPLEKDSLGAQEDASKQGRMIEEIDQNAEIAIDNEAQGRTNDDEMFGVDDLAGEEVVMDSAAEPVTIVKDSAAPTIDVTEDDIIMAQALAALKSVKPTILVAATKVTTVVPTPRAKSREREGFFEVQKARLLVELIEKRKKHFAAMRAQEKRNNPPTKTQMKNQMSTYLKHICGYKQSHLKGRSFDEIKELFDIEMRKVNDFIVMDLEAQKSSAKEAQESSTKRIAEQLKSDISKKQKADDNVIDDSKEL
nr:hypothetical protein [Tanacetum cinerariifolium]